MLARTQLLLHLYESNIQPLQESFYSSEFSIGVFFSKVLVFSYLTFGHVITVWRSIMHISLTQATANHCTTLGRIIFITQKWNPLFSYIIHLDQMIDLKDLQNIYRIFAMNIKGINRWTVALGDIYNQRLLVVIRTPQKDWFMRLQYTWQNSTLILKKYAHKNVWM